MHRNLSLFLISSFFPFSIIYLLAFALCSVFADDFRCATERDYTEPVHPLSFMYGCFFVGVLAKMFIGIHRVNTYLRTRNQLNSLMLLRSSKSNGFLFFLFCPQAFFSRPYIAYEMREHWAAMRQNLKSRKINIKLADWDWTHLSMFACVSIQCLFKFDNFPVAVVCWKVRNIDMRARQVRDIWQVKLKKNDWNFELLFISGVLWSDSGHNNLPWKLHEKMVMMWVASMRQFF